jgi:1-acyl-sn-glycerol-3-phosphate acyltransferase
MSSIVYHICNFLTMLLLGLFGRGQVAGLENIPSEGPLIVVSNHISWLDPPLIGATLGRHVHFMAKEELFSVPFVGWVVKNYGAFPVRRGESDRQAMHTALATLRAGGVLGMFPEGHRSETAQLQPGHSGAAVLAMRTGAPVLPIGITGSQNLLRLPGLLTRPRYKLNFGRTFVLAPRASRRECDSKIDHKIAGKIDKERLPRDALAEALDEMMQHIAELLPEEYKGVYGSKSYASKTG